MAPRLSARKPRQAPPTNVPPREVSAGDNSRAAEEAERVQLISFVNKITAQTAECDEAQAVFKGKQKARTQTFNLAKAAGFSRKELEARLAEMGRPTHVIAAEEVRVSKHRRWLGVLNPDQTKMFTGNETPQEVRDEENWRADGYRAGLLGLIAKPRFECPERFVQAWLRGHETGSTDYREAEAQRANPPVREQAAADFAEDNPEVDVDEAARKLKKSGFMVRTAPEEDSSGESTGSTPTPPDTSSSDGAEDGAGPDDGFEATEEELAAQKPRQAVVGAREGGDVV